MPFCTVCNASISNEALVALSHCKCGAAMPKVVGITEDLVPPLSPAGHALGVPIEDFPLEAPPPEEPFEDDNPSDAQIEQWAEDAEIERVEDDEIERVEDDEIERVEDDDQPARPRKRRGR